MLFYHSFTKNETVVEEEVKNHGNNGGEDESAGGLDEFISKWQVEALGKVKGEFV